MKSKEIHEKLKLQVKSWRQRLINCQGSEESLRSWKFEGSLEVNYCHFQKVHGTLQLLRLRDRGLILCLLGEEHQRYFKEIIQKLFFLVRIPNQGTNQRIGLSFSQRLFDEFALLQCLFFKSLYKGLKIWRNYKTWNISIVPKLYQIEKQIKHLEILTNFPTLEFPKS